MNEVTRYLQANAELQAARKDVLDIARCLADFARQLQSHASRVAFAGIDGSDLAARIGPACRTWDAAAAPTPGSIQAALERRAHAIEDALAAWDMVPPEMRFSLVAPRTAD
jgi:hypothetical protein